MRFLALLAAAVIPTAIQAQQMVTPLGIPMKRMGSGTTWIPDATPLPSREGMAGSWFLMVHGFGFVQYDAQGGSRGDEQFGSLNWGMLMASRDLAGGRFQVRTMLSLDAATVSNRGYPLLLQSGESYRGQPIHDRQHPHDFWMELAVMYERAVSSKLGLALYAAPSGEPALGPVAFMHRPSAMDNPFAPLSHHWQDATHISFGVVSAGIFGPSWKIEGSAFNGREPDEERWGFDRLRLNSYSGRLTINPSAGWSLAAGYGFLRNPDALRPAESLHRVTASLQYGRQIGTDGQWATALIWGVNRHSGEFSHSVLVESEAVFDHHNTLFGRFEVVDKTAEDLVLPVGPGGFAPESTLRVASLSLGYVRELARTRWNTLGLGVQATVNRVPSALEASYGSRTPLGGMLFIRLRPFHSPHSKSEMSMPGGTDAPRETP